MHKTYDIIKPVDQNELMDDINQTKIGAAVIEIVVGLPNDSDFVARRAEQMGVSEKAFRLWIEAIYTVEPPFIIGHDADNSSRVMRIDVVNNKDQTTEGAPVQDPGERKLRLSTFESTESE